MREALGNRRKTAACPGCCAGGAGGPCGWGTLYERPRGGQRTDVALGEP